MISISNKKEIITRNKNAKIKVRILNLFNISYVIIIPKIFIFVFSKYETNETTQIATNAESIPLKKQKSDNLFLKSSLSLAEI